MTQNRTDYRDPKVLDAYLEGIQEDLDAGLTVAQARVSLGDLRRRIAKAYARREQSPAAEPVEDLIARQLAEQIVSDLEAHRANDMSDEAQVEHVKALVLPLIAVRTRGVRLEAELLKAAERPAMTARPLPELTKTWTFRFTQMVLFAVALVLCERTSSVTATPNVWVHYGSAAFLWANVMFWRELRR